MPPNIFFLTGAPVAATLNWDPPGLLDDFVPPIARFLEIPQPTGAAISFISTTPRHASWRSLSIDPQLHLPTGYSQAHECLNEDKGGTAFSASCGGQSFQASDGHTQRSISESTDELSLFYEESFAIHEDVDSSQLSTPIIHQDEAHPEESMSDPDGSSVATAFGLDSCSPAVVGQRSRLPVPLIEDLTDLCHIPNAKYLGSIQPQTKTVNLIVGIITVSSPRVITTRRGDHVDLVELYVGDESKSGFGINIWLGSSSKSNNAGRNEPLRGILSNLRPQDIISLKNVALSSFRDMVYGQSLRKDMTKIHLLFRNRIDIKDTGGCYTVNDLNLESDFGTQISKVRRVRDWVMKFVGPAVIRKSGGGKFEIVSEVLPPDTQ